MAKEISFTTSGGTWYVFSNLDEQTPESVREYVVGANDPDVLINANELEERAEAAIAAHGFMYGHTTADKMTTVDEIVAYLREQELDKINDRIEDDFAEAMDAIGQALKGEQE